MKGGEVTAYRANGLLTLAWTAEKRKVPVILVSSAATAEMVTVHSHNRHVTPGVKPAVVDLYNNNINGVGVADQLGVYYSFQKKTLKWWRRFLGG